MENSFVFDLRVLRQMSWWLRKGVVGRLSTAPFAPQRNKGFRQRASLIRLCLSRPIEDAGNSPWSDQKNRNNEKKLRYQNVLTSEESGGQGLI